MSTKRNRKPNVNKPYIIMNRNNAVPAPAVGASLASRSWHEQSTQSFGAAGGGYIHIQEEGVWSQQMGGMGGTGEKEKKRKEGEKEARRVARSFKTSPIVVVAQRRSTSTYCG